MPWIQHDSSRCALDFCKNSWQDPGVLPILPPGWSKTFGHQLAQWFGTSQQNHKNVLNHVANQSYIPTTVLGIPCCLHCLFHVHLFSPTLFFWKKNTWKSPAALLQELLLSARSRSPPCNYAASWLCGKSGSFTRQAMCDQRRSQFHRTWPKTKADFERHDFDPSNIGKSGRIWWYDDFAIWKDGKGAMCSCINIPFVRGLSEFCVTFVGSWLLLDMSPSVCVTFSPGAIPAPVRYLAPDQPVPAFHSGSWRYFWPWYRGRTQDLAFLIGKIKAPSRSNAGRQLLFWLGSAWNFQSCQPLSMFMELDGSIAMYMKPASNLKNSKQSKH